MSEHIARVTRIQRFCTHDGPGIRTTVFFKGCPLRCAWCHNPETRSSRPGIMYADRMCVGCALCVSVCPNGAHEISDVHAIRAGSCTGCGRCAEVCPAGALEMDSALMPVSEIIAEVLKDRAFYGETGGLTISGGEPVLQSEACLALLRAAKDAGISTAIETCGFFDPRCIPELADATDFFLWDFKDSDAERHRLYTGHTSERIIANLRLLDSYPVRIHLRCIMVEGVNMTAEHAAAIAELYASLAHCVDVELLPYHAYGVSKAAQAGLQADPHREWIPSDERMAEFSDALTSRGVRLHVK